MEHDSASASPIPDAARRGRPATGEAGSAGPDPVVPPQARPARRRSTASDLWARARANVDVGRPATGIRLAERALHELDQHDQPDPMLRARITLVLADANVELGQIALAEDLLRQAATAGPDIAPVVRASRGVLLARTGHMRQARRELDGAIADLERASPDGGNLVRALLWRGLLNLSEGRLDEAAADCERARELGVRRGMDAAVLIATHTAGLVNFVSGDLPGALQLMSQADEQPTDVRLGFRALDRARVLLAAGLIAEAREFAGRAGETFLAERARVDLAETLLVQAEIDLMDRRPGRAAMAATRAARIYSAAHHSRGVLAARLMQARADALDRVVTRSRDGRRARADAARAAALAADLTATGLREDARAARVLEADAQLSAGHLADAEEALDRARSEATTRAAVVPTVATELHSRLVAARIELARGRAAAGMSQVRRGLDDLAAFQAKFGSQDLQSAAAVHGSELTRLGLRTALESRSPAAILQWLERSRGASTRMSAVRPPVDSALAKDLSRLRVAAYRARLASRSGAPDRELEAIVEDLRRRVRSRSWTAGGSGAVDRPISLTAVQRRLAQTSPRVSVVAPFRGRGRFHALVITADTARYIAVDPDFALEVLLHRMIGDLNILADHRIRSQLRTVAVRSLRTSVGGVATAIVDPIQPYVDDGPVIIAAAGAAAIVPWALLPGLSGRAVSVATSVTSAMSSLGDHRLDHGRGVLAVAGPDVPHGIREAGAVAEVHPGSTLLTGSAATGRAVLDAMPARGLVHIAAHGQHEQDNPLFSGVLLADGLLYGYDVAPNPALPAHVVLSSCDVGRTDDRPGGEPLGLVAALLRSGVSTVIAGTSRISDSVAATAMTGYHQRLRAGDPPAVALAGAIQQVAEQDDDPAPFTCFGAGL